MDFEDAEFVIVGGGAVGCGVAYALVRAGHTDIIILEREEQLGAVTSAQGAGLCGQVRDGTDRVRLAMHSVSVFRELQKSSEARPDWIESGSLRIALNARRADEFRQLRQVAAEAGLETELMDAGEAKRLWPHMDFSSAKAILWCASDGCLTPSSLVQSYAHHCRKEQVRIYTGAMVEEILTGGGRVTGVKTKEKTIHCRYVINAAGAHAYHIARLAGLDLPIVPVRHEYFVTVAMPGLRPDFPCFRIPELTLYGRVREGGILLGGWEPNAVHLDPRDYKLKKSPPKVEEDWEVLSSFEQKLAGLLPAVKEAPKTRVGKGWPTFTPDGRFMIGESNRLPGFVMAGGCNAHGISGSGGIGKLVVEALFEARPSAYLQSLSPDRFTRAAWNWDEACREARRIYETYYGVEC